MLPAMFLTANMKTVNPGTWLLNCMVTGSYDNGMYTLFNVTKCAREAEMSMPSGGTTRRYFIAAEETLWNYGPSGLNKITGKPLTKPGRYLYLSEIAPQFFLPTQLTGRVYFLNDHFP